MKYEEQLKLMGYLIQLGFGREYIMSTLYYTGTCSLGIGASMIKSIKSATCNQTFDCLVKEVSDEQ